MKIHGLASFFRGCSDANALAGCADCVVQYHVQYLCQGDAGCGQPVFFTEHHVFDFRGGQHAVVCAFPAEKGIAAQFAAMNWTGLVLGFVLVALEGGYIYAYRAGWNVSVLSIVANIALAVILRCV